MLTNWFHQALMTERQRGFPLPTPGVPWAKHGICWLAFSVQLPPKTRKVALGDAAASFARGLAATAELGVTGLMMAPDLRRPKDSKFQRVKEYYCDCHLNR
jgi:hypothetical protein